MSSFSKGRQIDTRGTSKAPIPARDYDDDQELLQPRLGDTS